MQAQTINSNMLEVMARPDVKAHGLHLQIEIKDGTKRTGTYCDLVVNPMKRPDFKDVQFIVFKTNKPEAGLTVYLPITQIATIAWSY